MNSSKSEDISPHSVVASCTVNSGDTNQTDSNKTTQQQQVNNNSNNDLLPIEYQLYEVDLTHPDIDPLEYTFRKYVPIPKESPRLVLVCCVKNVVSVTLYSYSNKVQLTCTNIICLPPFHLHKSYDAHLIFQACGKSWKITVIVGSKLVLSYHSL